MKKLITFALLAHALTTFLCAQERQYRYILNLDMPIGICSNDLHGYYQGSRFNFDEHWATIPESRDISAFSIIISQSLQFKSYRTSGNTIQCLTLTDTKDCLWYDITRTITGDWLIEKRNTEDLATRIPEYAIVLNISPTLIEKVECCYETPESLATTTVLPTIFFKKTLTQKMFNDALDIATLASLNLSAVHKTVEQEKVISAENHIITRMITKK